MLQQAESSQGKNLIHNFNKQTRHQIITLLLRCSTDPVQQAEWLQKNGITINLPEAIFITDLADLREIHFKKCSHQDSFLV